MPKASKTAEYDVKQSATVIDGVTLKPDPTPPKIDLHNSRAVYRELCRVYREARAGTMETDTAGKLTYMLKTIGDMHKTTVIEAQIEQIQHTLKLQNQTLII